MPGACDHSLGTHTTHTYYICIYTPHIHTYTNHIDISYTCVQHMYILSYMYLHIYTCIDYMHIHTAHIHQTHTYPHHTHTHYRYTYHRYIC